jgi:sugar phosphate isomerase/epimerase
MTDERALLVESIGADLEKSGQAVRDVEAPDPDRVKLVRSAGREAARDRGWKVQTLATEVGAGYVRIHVVVTEADPLHQQLWDAKNWKAMRRAMNEL